MKCPKCGYLGFEDTDRCRNCGYEFSLATAEVVPDLTLRRKTQPLNPLEDLTLVDRASAYRATDRTPSGAGNVTDLTPAFDAAAALEAGRGDEELPLFGEPFVDDTPLITRASAPRPPLAVRRATPEVPRLRTEQPRFQAFDPDFDESERESRHEPDLPPAARVAERSPRRTVPAAAGIGARLIAVIIDLTILAAIDALVVYFTMEICGLTPADLGMLPKGPLAAFMLVQNAGYLAAFTAGGQTLGKMATGIRVVGTEAAGALDFGRAVTRTVVWLILAVPAGLGFLTLFSHDHRGLHDRFAGTRVVRVSA